MERLLHQIEKWACDRRRRWKFKIDFQANNDREDLIWWNCRLIARIYDYGKVVEFPMTVDTFQPLNIKLDPTNPNFFVELERAFVAANAFTPGEAEMTASFKTILLDFIEQQENLAPINIYMNGEDGSIWVDENPCSEDIKDRGVLIAHITGLRIQFIRDRNDKPINIVLDAGNPIFFEELKSAFKKARLFNKPRRNTKPMD